MRLWLDATHKRCWERYVKEKEMGNEADRLSRQGRRDRDDQVAHAINEHGKKLVKALNAYSDNVGKWLSVIALALSTQHPDSEAVQKKIDEFTAALSASSDVVEAAMNEDKKGT